MRIIYYYNVNDSSYEREKNFRGKNIYRYTSIIEVVSFKQYVYLNRCNCIYHLGL